MAIPGYLTIEGTRQGLISANASTDDSIGAGYQVEHRDQIMIQAFRHCIYTADSTGRRMYKAMVITKQVDITTPLLQNAIAEKEPLKRCVLKFYRPKGEGGRQHFFTYELLDALITQTDIALPNCADAANAQLPMQEHIRIVFRKIIATHEVCGTLGIDQWR